MAEGNMERAEVTELRAEIERLQRELDDRSAARDQFELDDKLYNRRVRTVKLAATIMLMFMVVFSMIPVGYNLFRNDFFELNSRSEAPSLINDAFKAATDKNIENLNNYVAALRQDRSVADSESIRLAISGVDLKLLKDRVNVLEGAISNSPERALSIPLLRRDQENMSKLIESNRQAVDAQLARIYDQQKWMLTGIGTALLAALTALGGALYRMFSRSPD